MTGSKVGQFFQQVLHLRTNSSGSNTDGNTAAAGKELKRHSSSSSSSGADAGAEEPNVSSSSTATAATATAAGDASNPSSTVRWPLNDGPASPDTAETDAPMSVDVQQANGTTTTTEVPPSSGSSSSQPNQQQQQQQQAEAAAAEVHSGPLPDAAAAAGEAAAGEAGEAAGPATPTASTAADAAAAARSVTWSPGHRSLSGAAAAAAAGSSSAGRTSIGALSRRSMGALQLSHSLAGGGGDGFKVRVGICAMDKKATSKPMREIVNRLEGYGEFEVVRFGDDLISHAPITEWPRVDCLMSWYSEGFPLSKAQAYADATRPFLINDLHMQDVLADRRAVYRLLQENGILVPTHIVVSREGLTAGEDPPGFIEEEDYVELGGVRIAKPFVEKPASGEDHNIHIYYPHSMGGGVKRLFRKVDNKSSCYDPNHPGTVRRDGSYIYEEFLATGGTDVKVYTVGPRYAHAEARKSPVVDGRVLRTADGKEMRFPVLLNPAEKEISRTVCLAFGQKVCGFDLLRSEKGRSYVCDVNGWSFVKNSRKYYDDAAGILRSTILAALAPHRLALPPSSGSPLSFTLGLSPLTQQAAGDAAAAAAAAASAAGYDEESLGLMRKTASLQELSSLMAELSGVDLMEATRTDERSTREELRCVLAVVRHGDRTPKQKLKVRVRQPSLLALFQRHADSKGKQAKLKSPAQLQELLDICRSLLAELEHPPPLGVTEEEVESREEQREKLAIVRTVLEQGGQFSGINRKVQLKPLVWSTPPPAAAAAQTSATSGSSSGGQGDAAPDAPQQQEQGSYTAGGAAEDPNNQLDQQQQQQQQQPVLEEVLLILKYGGVLTHAGRAQAEELGKVFRLVMYPRYGSTGGGLLRLHSTYRHDFKIYSSDEGRVQVSAAAFTKGLLALEGSSLTPILVSLVTKDASMLDAFGKGASEDIRRAKQILYTAMTWDPHTSTSNHLTPAYSRSTTPAPTPLITSPPLSPRNMIRASSSGGGGGGGGGGSARVSAGSANPAAAEGGTLVAAAAAAAAEADSGPSSTAAGDGDGSSAAVAAAAAAAAVAGSAAGVQVSGSPEISGMPDAPLQHLKRLYDLMKHMVDQLRQLVMAEKKHGKSTTASSSAKDLTAPAAAAGAAGAQHSSSVAVQPSASFDPSSDGGLLTSMTSLTNPPGMTKQQQGMTNTAGVTNSPQRPSTAPPGGAAAAGCGSGSGGSSGSSSSSKGGCYSSLSHDPQDWSLEPDKPCSGEKLLLMFDRWKKLEKSFCKKGRYDISKVPDIYDSAKYDALHNSHLGLGATLEELYREAKILADAVIPNEYGVDAASKLAIGSKIATELLAKLLDDLRASKEESLATLTDAERSGLAAPSPAGGEGLGFSTGPRNPEPPLTRKSMPALRPPAAAAGGSGGGSSSSSSTAAAGVSRVASAGAALVAAAAAGEAATGAAAAGSSGSDHAGGDEAEVEVFGECDEGFDTEPEFMHRLCPMYASDINSPLRHVRTRIYFTSESHMHSLVNLLRYCHLRYSLLGSSSSSSAAAADGSSRASMDVSRSSLDISAAAPEAAAGSGTAATAVEPAAAAAASAAAAPWAPRQGSAAGLNGGGSSSGSNSSMQNPGPLLSEEGFDLLKSTTELDYLTHLVFRLYENMTVPADHPERFRIEVLFCPGASYDPTQIIPPKGNHTLPPRPRVDLHRGDGGTLADFDRLLRPFAAKRSSKGSSSMAQAQSGGSTGLPSASSSKGV